MNQKVIDCPTRDDLLEFLSAELDDHGSPTVAHLSDCTECRQRLETLSASAEVWDEARESLTPLGNEFLATRQFPQPGNSIVHDATEGLGPIDESAYLKILGPTDDPNMMGRIGSYEVVGVVGRGGMGVVFKAYDAPLNRFVAIKMLLPHLAVSAPARQRFAREAQAAAAVIDDHVTPIYNVAQWKKVPYIVTQYCSGVTLQKRIADRGQLTLKEVLRIGMQTAQGLAAAHAQGLVHRDVKPSNILLDGEVERAMLTDFGLARAVDDASITRTGVITGTPQYMSPEQARGDSIDARSDLFSLGSTLYAMCAGRPPFRSESAYGVMHRITHEEPTPICEVNSDVPPWMATIIERLMSKNVEDRFESAEEVAQLMEGCLAHVQQPTTTNLPKTLASIGIGRGGSSSWGKWLAMASFAFLLALGGILLVFELNKGKLVIECAADNVPIRIMQGDEEIESLTVSKNGAMVKVAAGKYLVEIDGGSDKLVLKNDVATLSRGGVETVTISLKGANDSESVAGGWVPPKDSDLTDIRHQAVRDAAVENYELALQKHVWYHENSNQVPSEEGVRLSYAMSSWFELCEVYPPALTKMREMCEAVEAKIRDEDRVRVRFEDFHDFVAFNRTLKQEERTAKLFKWLDGYNAEDAKRIYPIAEATLMKQKEYEICGKYIEPIEDVRKICEAYESGLEMSERFGESYESYLRYMRKTFVADGATLVNILLKNDRAAEAQVAAASLRKFAEGKDVADKLDAALNAALEEKTEPTPKVAPEKGAANSSATGTSVNDVAKQKWGDGDPLEIAKRVFAERRKLLNSFQISYRTIKPSAENYYDAGLRSARQKLAAMGNPSGPRVIPTNLGAKPTLGVNTIGFSGSKIYYYARPSKIDGPCSGWIYDGKEMFRLRSDALSKPLEFVDDAPTTPDFSRLFCGSPIPLQFAGLIGMSETTVPYIDELIRSDPNATARWILRKEGSYSKPRPWKSRGDKMLLVEFEYKIPILPQTDDGKPFSFDSPLRVTYVLAPSDYCPIWYQTQTEFGLRAFRVGLTEKTPNESECECRSFPLTIIEEETGAGKDIDNGLEVLEWSAGKPVTPKSVFGDSAPKIFE